LAFLFKLSLTMYGTTNLRARTYFPAYGVTAHNFWNTTHSGLKKCIIILFGI